MISENITNIIIQNEKIMNTNYYKLHTFKLNSNNKIINSTTPVLVLFFLSVLFIFIHNMTYRYTFYERDEEMFLQTMS